MEENNAIILKNVTKSFSVDIVTVDAKKKLYKNSVKRSKNIVIDDISLEIKKGDVLGIVGRNGSGKSTLLSLIAKILVPDEGLVVCNGKVASILELGMGFHPDMTGRDNIYLKSELYGFDKKEIDKKIDTIIDYSGIRGYIDNPVRTYSSGMMGRLAFSIMVNVESDIMIVDEVLSTGDATFSLKAREHFRKMAKTKKTIVFVSHNLHDLESMCNRIIWIEDGKIVEDGKPSTVVSHYQNAMISSPEIIYDLAMGGVSKAQYDLALMYKCGNFFDRNYDMYRELLKKSAEQGYIKAQIEYADVLMDSNPTEALIYLQSAALKGDQFAKQKLSMINSNSDNDYAVLDDILKKAMHSNDSTWVYRYAEFKYRCAKSMDDYAEAFGYYLRAAELDNVSAIYQIAIMYRDGIGIGKNYIEMEKYLKMGVNHNHLQSILLLADIYLQGKLLQKDESQALNLYTKAAEMGNAGALFKLATFYSEGIGVEADVEKSNKYYKKYNDSLLNIYRTWAFEYIKNNKTGVDSLTSILSSSVPIINSAMINALLSNSESCKDDVHKNIESLCLLSDNDNIESIKILGKMYVEGVAVDRNPGRALSLFEKGAKLGDPWCKNKCAEMYRDGVGTVADVSKSIHHLNDLAERGNVQAISSLINIYLGMSDAPEEEVIALVGLLENLANTGNVEACKRLGIFFMDGVAVDRNPGRALSLFEKGAKLGDPWCKNKCAEMYRDGVGTVADVKKAIRWWMEC